MEDINDEMEAIEAIYCGENEFQLQSKDDSSVTFSVTTNPINDQDLKITLTFVLSVLTYPSEPPSISVQSQYLTRHECDNIKAFLHKEAESLCGSSMILNIITALQDKKILRQKFTNSTETKIDEEDLITCVLHLDHMRNKAQYTKTIKRWCEELGIFGRLLFCQRWIFIILQSNESNIKIHHKIHAITLTSHYGIGLNSLLHQTYIQRNKHQCVDVDSSGHPCKERLLSTLYHGCEDTLAFSNFQVINLDQQNDLKNYLTQHNLCNVYLHYIFPLINKK